MEMLSVLLAFCVENPLLTIGFPSQLQRASNLDIFFVTQNKLWNQQYLLVIWDTVMLVVMSI